MPDGIDYHSYDGMGDLPHFSPVAEGEALPPTVLHLHRQLNNADAIIICTPEYAFGLPGSLKNLLDWTVSTGNFADKPVAVITASSSGQYAHPALLTILGALSANVIKNGTLLISFIRAKMNIAGEITDGETEDQLRAVFESLLKSIN